MTTNEIGFLIEKLSEKVGVATDKIAPIATEIVDQYVRGHMAMFWVGMGIIVAGFIIGFVLSVIDDGDKGWMVMCGLGGLVIGALIGFVNLYCALAPLPSMLRL